MAGRDHRAGPLTIGEGADDRYRNPRLRGAALADGRYVEIRRLADAGCPVIRVDEPAFARKVEDALAFGIRAPRRLRVLSEAAHSL